MKYKYYDLYEKFYQQQNDLNLPYLDLGNTSLNSSSLISFLQEWLPKFFSQGDFLHLNVLVLGCGAGETCRFLASLGCHVLGVDISPTAIALANQATLQAPATTPGSIQYLVGDFCSDLMPRLNKKFDLIIDDHTLHCLIDDSDRQKFYHHAFTLLKNGGYYFSETLASHNHLLFADCFIFDEHSILWQKLDDQSYFPLRRIEKSIFLEQEIVQLPWTLFYFYYCSHLKMNILHNESVPPANWPCLIRIICHRPPNSL